MNRVANKFRQGRAAFRAVAALLVVVLMTSLVADMRHHSRHAVHSHDSHSVSADSAPVNADSLMALDRKDGSWSVIASQPDGHEQHGSGAAPCECCAATCFAFTLVGTAPIGHTRFRSVPNPAEAAALAPGSPHSFDRPPIAFL